MVENPFESNYKATTPEILRELDDRVRRMWYAPNADMGKLEADDLLARIKQLQGSNYIVPQRYGMLEYSYGEWLSSLSQTR